jgi:hypothetical protein
MVQLSVNPWTFLIVDHHANFPKPPAATQGSGLSLAIDLFCQLTGRAAVEFLRDTSRKQGKFDSKIFQLLALRCR